MRQHTDLSILKNPSVIVFLQWRHTKEMVRKTYLSVNIEESMGGGSRYGRPHVVLNSVLRNASQLSCEYGG